MEIRGDVVDTSDIPARNLAPRLSPTARRSPALEQALVSAVAQGDLTAMNRLLGQGANVNASVPGDGSPLIAAARQGRRDLADALLQKGANIDMGVEGDGNPLIAAAAAGHAGTVQHLLDRGANIEAVVLSDENALMQASYHGHVAVVRLLIARGADVNSRVGRRTPLVMARLGGHGTIATLLQRAGAKG
jgi:ankyrin repeat protein